jgi:hypothetical protein
VGPSALTWHACSSCCNSHSLTHTLTHVARLQLLLHLARKDVADFSNDGPQATLDVGDVVLYGLSLIQPLITPEALGYAMEGGCMLGKEGGGRGTGGRLRGREAVCEGGRAGERGRAAFSCGRVC